MKRNLITIHLWPKNSIFMGKRVDKELLEHSDLFTKIEIEPTHLEVLITEYKRTPEMYEQECARSFECALREWREEVIAEDERENVPC